MRPHSTRWARLLPAIAVASLAGAPSPALPEDLVVERLGEERGFPSETITALYRDRAGFLWVGSREGLAVWDGYSVRAYEHEVGDAHSLPDNSIRTIYEDKAGHLWVGTNTGGLALLDRATGRFEVLRHDPANPRSLSHDSVYAIAEDQDGFLWIGTQEGLNRFDPHTRTFDRLRASASDPATIPHDYVYALDLDRRGRLWIATVGGGIAWIDPRSRRVTRIPFDPASGVTDPDRLMYGVIEDRQGALWFGSERAFYRYDEAKGSLHRLDLPELAPSKDQPIVTSLALDLHGLIWMSTWNRGLVAYDPASGTSHGYRHDPERAESLAADRLTCILSDEAGDLWVGTWGSGINRFSSSGDLFRAVLERRPGEAPGLPYREVTSVLEDRQGRLWAGTWGKGLCRRDLPGGDFTEIPPPAELPSATGAVLALAEGADGAVWAGSYSGLLRIDPVSLRGRKFPWAPANTRGVGAGDCVGS